MYARITDGDGGVRCVHLSSIGGNTLDRIERQRKKCRTHSMTTAAATQSRATDFKHELNLYTHFILHESIESAHTTNSSTSRKNVKEERSREEREENNKKKVLSIE